MKAPANIGHELLLIGFVDLVASELRANGLRVARQRGLGQIAPVASNDTPQGRLRNRRVEVWIRPSTAPGAATSGGWR